MIKKIYKVIIKNLVTIIFRVSVAGRFDQKKTLMITSSPRSGSTLLGQVLGALPRTCSLFEPLHLDRVPDAKVAGFSWRTFVDPEEQWPEGEAFLTRVFKGDIVNNWTTREVSFRESCISNRLIVKFVRANRLLPWICHKFSLPSPILLLRHPCAVIASQLDAGWKEGARIEIPQYLNGYPKFKNILSKISGDEEYLAALWALDQLPALVQPTPHPWIIITYEELVLRPECTLLKILSEWKLSLDMNEALSRMALPSSVVSHSGIKGINGWKNALSDEQVSRILNTINSFGLSFYSRDDEADYSNLLNERLPHTIKKMWK